MKKEKMTPEDFASNLCDPDFLNEEGGLIPTSKNGRVKEMVSKQDDLAESDCRRRSPAPSEIWPGD